MLANGVCYWLRPSFIFSYMTGTADELAYPLLLAAHDVPFWLLTLGFGRNDMFWYASSSGWGETVWWEPPSTTRPSCLASGGGRASRRLGRPEGLRRDNRRRGLRFGRRADGLADDAHLEEAYGVFAAEARDVDPEYALETDNKTVGRRCGMRSRRCFLITVVLCFCMGS